MLSAHKELLGAGSSNFLVFIGGFIGAMTHFVSSISSLLSLRVDELFDFTIRSLIGGTIMLAVKVLGDWILHKIKTPKNKNGKDE